MAIFSTVAEYDAEIVNVRASITRALKLGQSTGTSVAGNSRNNSEVDLDKLRSYLTLLLRERDCLKGRVLIPRAGW